MESIEKLRESSHLDDNKWTLETGEVVFMFGNEVGDPNAVNWGEQWRSIADEIEAEIESRYMLLPVDADGVPVRVGDELECHANGYDGAFTVFAIGNDVVVGNHDIEWLGHNPSKWFHVASFCTHAKPRTIEDVLRELVEYVTNGTNVDSYEKDIAGYADELRGMMEVDS